MQSSTCLVKFSFTCPRCKNVNSKLNAVRFIPDFAAKADANSIRLVCTYCGVLATRVVIDDLRPASLDPVQFERVAELADRR